MEHVTSALGHNDEPSHDIADYLGARLRAVYPPVALLGAVDSRAVNDRVCALLERIDRVADAQTCLSVRLAAVERETAPLQGSPK